MRNFGEEKLLRIAIETLRSPCLPSVPCACLPQAGLFFLRVLCEYLCELSGKREYNRISKLNLALRPLRLPAFLAVNFLPNAESSISQSLSFLSHPSTYIDTSQSEIPSLKIALVEPKSFRSSPLFLVDPSIGNSNHS